MTHNRTIRSLLILLAGTAAVAAVIAAARPAGAAVAYPYCRTGNVSLTLRHPVSSGGNTGVTVTLRNTSGTSCSVRGYPALGLELHGLPVKSRTGDGSTYFASDPGPSVVTLEPGGRAVAHVSFGTVSGPGSVRASVLDVAWRGAHWHEHAGLPGAPAYITSGVLETTAWERG